MAERTQRRETTQADQGLPLETTVERELLPRLVLAHRPDADLHPAPAAPSEIPIGPAVVGEFVQRLLDPREELASQLVSSLVTRGASVEAIYCELLGPAARQLGTLWEDDACDFLQVTVGLGRLQQTLRDLSAIFSSRRTRCDQPGSILVTGLPDEQHTLGLLIVAEFFVRDGWAVNVGHPLIEQTLVEVVRGDWYDVIGVSLALPERAGELRGTLTRMRKASRNASLVILLGGQAYLDDADLVQRVGADAGIADVRSAPAVAREQLRRLGRPAPVPVS